MYRYKVEENLGRILTTTNDNFYSFIVGKVILFLSETHLHDQFSSYLSVQ